jgi:hypothetical protein
VIGDKDRNVPDLIVGQPGLPRFEVAAPRAGVSVFSTVGFGDIAPRSQPVRIVLIVQMLGDLAVLGAGVRVLLGAVRRGRQRKQAQATPTQLPDPTRMTAKKSR